MRVFQGDLVGIFVFHFLFLKIFLILQTETGKNGSSTPHPLFFPSPSNTIFYNLAEKAPNNQKLEEKLLFQFWHKFILNPGKEPK